MMEEVASPKSRQSKILLTAMKTLSAIPDIYTIYLLEELLEVFPTCRGRRAVRPAGAISSSGFVGLSIALDGRAGVGAICLVDGKWVSSSTAQELLGSSMTEELLGIPSDIILVVSGHPAEAQLIVDGHGETDVLLLIRHLIVASLWSLNANAYQNQEQQEHLGLIEDHEEIKKKKNKNKQI
jgi:hypothetical protein